MLTGLRRLGLATFLPLVVAGCAGVVRAPSASEQARGYVKLGFAEASLAATSQQPGTHYRRARESFVRAREIWQSGGDEVQSEAVAKLIRRLDDEWRRRTP